MGAMALSWLVLVTSAQAQPSVSNEATRLAGPRAPVWSVAFSPDGKRLAAGAQDGIWIWTVAAQTEPIRVPSAVHFRGPHSVAFLSDGKTLAFLYHDKEERSGLKRWDMEAKKETDLVTPSRNPIYDFAFTPDGKTVVTADDLDLTLRDGTTGKVLMVLPSAHRCRLSSLAVSPDGKTMVSGDNCGRLVLWDLGRQKPIAVLREMPETPYERPAVPFGVSYSSDSKSIAGGFGVGPIVLWDVAERKERLRLPVKDAAVPSLGVTAVAFSPDAKLIAAAGKIEAPEILQIVQVYDTDMGQLVAELRSGRLDKGIVESLAFAPDGKRLATAGNDGVKLWDLAKIRGKSDK
jgi:WD40 repeat protein